MTFGFDNQQLKLANRKLSAYIRKTTYQIDNEWMVDSIFSVIMVLLGFRMGLPVLALLIVTLACLFILRSHVLDAHNRRVSDTKLTANVINKILLGPQELESIYGYTPIPWRWFFLKGKPQKLEDWVLLVAQNLSWYQHES